MKAALTLIALSVSPAVAQLAVTSREVVRHPYFFTGCRALDLDGDGDTDLLLSGDGNNLTSWCENRGDGSFAPPAAITMKPQVFNWGLPFTPDLAGQGRPDLVTRWSTTRTRQPTPGGFATPEPLPGTPWPTPVAAPQALFREVVTVFPGTRDRLIVEEWDQEGQADLHALFYSLDEEGNPSVSPVIAGGEDLIEHVGSIDPDNLFPTDIDGDGDIDLVYQYLWLTDPVVILRNQGDDTFAAREDLSGEGLYSLNISPPVLLHLPGEEFPALAVMEYPEDGSFSIVIRTQSETGGHVSFDPPQALHRISLEENDSIMSMASVSRPEGDELWTRMWPRGEPDNPQPSDHLQCYRFTPGTGWQQALDLALPAKGFGEILPLTITAGNPGLACRLGGLPGVNADSEEKVVWASLASLRSGTPSWQTLAGPFNDFLDFRVADLDQDGKLDLVSGDGSHGMSGGKSGRIHFIHDIENDREHRVIDTESTSIFGGASPLPGNRIAIGHAVGSPLPDLAVSNGYGTAIRLLENLGNRQFGAPLDLATSGDILRPLRLDDTRHRFFDGSRIFTQSPSPGSPATPLSDLGIAGEVVFTDMDGDGDQDVVAAPCPLGQVTGWGKTGPSGSIESWHLLSTVLAKEVRTSSGVPQLGWIQPGPSPSYKQVREGIPGILSRPLPATIPAEALAGDMVGHPVDLDQDGDLDRLTLRPVEDEAAFGISPLPMQLVWHENLGSNWLFHPEPLFRMSYAPASLEVFVLQEIDHPEDRRLLVGNGQGEVFLLDLSNPIPGGTFGAWLASFNLTGASAGAESDPDDDGLTNLEEALQGTSPVAATPGHFAIPTALASPDGWTFSSALNLTGTGINVTSEVSTDLSEWQELPGEPAFIMESGGRSHYRVADSAMTGEAKRFVRFRFAWQP